jgi:predicted ATPase
MGVEEVILDRLSADGVTGEQADLILAALIGEDELARAASGDGGARPGPEAGRREEHREPARAYLASIAVEGFRGIGQRAELRLRPGPGLTLVTGRNGCGKSSLAEAAELALTGGNVRWSGTGHSVERGGWRNLHHAGPPRIEVSLCADGAAGVRTVTCEWAGDGLDSLERHVRAPGGEREPAASLGWETAMQVYRPFLGYAELGALVSGKPSQMHDAMEAILGLDQLREAEARLAAVRKELEAASRRAAKGLPELRERLAGHQDPRAEAARRELARKVPDLDALAALASGGDAPGDDVTARLRQVTAITLPGPGEAAAALRDVAEAEAAVTALAGTAAADARRVAGLLRAAVSYQRDHDGEPCPVCGGRPLDAAWARAAAAEAARLDGAAADAARADSALEAARARLAGLTGPAPAVLAQDLGGDAAPAGARQAWDRWEQGRSEESFRELLQALSELRQQADAALRRRAGAWQPAAAALAEWAGAARESRRAAARLSDVKLAISWLRATGTALRNERLAPFSEMSARVWQTLRQESNVELGPVTLAGSGPARKVSLDVTVDGVPGAALSVMSQGELHALGLALFLPRATADDSPFRFIVIDDPVQSMDPAKVDGLARLLSDVARTRQVVVFTHDDRLPAAIRQLQLPATIWAVTRREQSAVCLSPAGDPVLQYADDARAIALAGELEDPVKAVAVAGLCRYAVEAACLEAVRARRIAAGTPHAEVEKTLEETRKLRSRLALALFDDSGRGGDVKPELARLGDRASPGKGQAFVSVFDALNSGTHQPRGGDLMQLIRDTEDLAKALRQ